MFRGFNLSFNSLKDGFVSQYKAHGVAVISDNASRVRETLKAMAEDRITLDGDQIRETWFPRVEADIFLSHSHRDLDAALALAGWLKEELGLTAFVDSSVWGYAPDLLKLIDNEYCRNVDGKTYDYDKRNYSTSHVHAMLSTALAMMIDKTECLLFLSTPQSVSSEDVVKTSGIRCSMSNYLALSYGTYCHEDARNFYHAFAHAEWLQGLHAETERSKEKFVEHFRNDYIEYPKLPVWVAAEVMSFGTLSFMYKGLNGSDQAELAKPFGVNKVVVQSWLHTLAFVRNICAHHSRLWNRELSVAPKFPHEAAWKPPAIPDPKKVYGVLCILRHLSVDEFCGDKWRRHVVGLLERWDAEPRWRNAMGIPVDWKNSVFWS